MASKKLTNKEIYERLHSALLLLGQEPADTLEGEQALSTAKTSLELLQYSLLRAEAAHDGGAR